MIKINSAGKNKIQLGLKLAKNFETMWKLGLHAQRFFHNCRGQDLSALCNY